MDDEKKDIFSPKTPKGVIGNVTPSTEIKSPSTVDNSVPQTNESNGQKAGDKKKEEDIKLSKQGRLQWTDQTEELLSSWADIAACYKWLHEQSFRKYSTKNYRFAVPVIVLSTIAGTLSVSIQGYVPEAYVSYAQAGIGAINIFTGILTTLQSLFKYAQTSEAHNNVSIGWSKLQRNISIELSVSRESRKDPDSFIKIQRSEYDRLIEQSPTISTDVIELFKKKFEENSEKRKEDIKKKLKKRQKMLIKKGLKDEADKIEEDMEDKLDEDELILPDICDNINHTKIYRDTLNGINLLQDNREQDPLDMSTSYNNAVKQILPEIKDALLKERFKNIDEKISGVNQFKLAIMGERLSPIMNEMNEHKEKEVEKIIDKEIEMKIKEKSGYRTLSIEKEEVKKPIIEKLRSVNYVPPKLTWSERRNSETQKTFVPSVPAVNGVVNDIYVSSRQSVLKELENIKNISKVKNARNIFDQPSGTPIQQTPIQQTPIQQTPIQQPQAQKEDHITDKIKHLGIPVLDLTKAYEEIDDTHDNKTERSEMIQNANEEDFEDNNIHIKINIPDR